MEPLKGLITAPNTLQTDPYSVITADDVVVDIGGYLRTREGQKEILNISENSPVSTITNVGTDYYYFMENGTIYRNSSQIGSGYVIPDIKTGAQALTIGNIIYSNTINQNAYSSQTLGGGIKIYNNNIGLQGCPRPVIASLENGTIYNDYNSWIIKNNNESNTIDSVQYSSCSYCCTIEYTDDNGRIIESEPSNIATRTFINAWVGALTSNAVNSNFNSFKIYCYNSNINDVNRNYILNIYRTDIYTINYQNVDGDKYVINSISNDRLFYLIDSIKSSNFTTTTSGGITIYNYTYTDRSTEPTYTKKPLYSNNDATKQNSNTQIHKIFSKFKEYYVYANTNNKRTISINLNNPWSKSITYSTPAVSNNLILNSTNYSLYVTVFNYGNTYIKNDGALFQNKIYLGGGVFSPSGTNLYNENALISNISSIYIDSSSYTEISLLNNILFNNPQNARVQPFLTSQSLILELNNFENQNNPPLLYTVSTTNDNILGIIKQEQKLYKNYLYYSKFQEPDSVPRLNYIEIGDGSEILGVKQLRQSLFIFKENDGVYILRGNTPEDWSLLRLYPDLRLVAPRTLVVMEDSIIGLFNLGIVAVSENGYEPLSKDIKDIIEPFTRSATPEKQWAVDDKTNRRYYAFIDVGTNGSKPFVFDFYTNSWTRFTYERNAGVYANGKLITTLLEGGVNKIYEQEQGKYVDTSLLGVETKINSTIEFRKFVGDQFALSKVFKDMVLFFRNNNFNSLKISYLTNLTNSYYTYSISLIKNLTYVLGNVIRSLVPREYSRGNWLGVKIATDPTVAVVDKTKPEFALEGVEVFFNKTTNKT